MIPKGIILSLKKGERNSGMNDRSRISSKVLHILPKARRDGLCGNVGKLES